MLNPGNHLPEAHGALFVLVKGHSECSRWCEYLMLTPYSRKNRDLGTRQLVADQEIMLVQQSKASVEAANASLRQDL
jgi:hypothetical protein